MSVIYHPVKANMVENAPSRLSMGSIFNIKEEKKELVRDTHILARLSVE